MPSIRTIKKMREKSLERLKTLLDKKYAHVGGYNKFMEMINNENITRKEIAKTFGISMDTLYKIIKNYRVFTDEHLLKKYLNEKYAHVGGYYKFIEMINNPNIKMFDIAEHFGFSRQWLYTIINEYKINYPKKIRGYSKISPIKQKQNLWRN